MQLDAASGEIGYHDAAECVGGLDRFVEEHPERGGEREEVCGEEGDDGVGGLRGEVAEAAFGDEESREV